MNVLICISLASGALLHCEKWQALNLNSSNVKLLFFPPRPCLSAQYDLDMAFESPLTPKNIFSSFLFWIISSFYFCLHLFKYSVQRGLPQACLLSFQAAELLNINSWLLLLARTGTKDTP